MNANELRSKSAQELKALLESEKRAQFKLRLQRSGGGEFTKTDMFKKIRRNIARIQTILTSLVKAEGKS